MPTKQSHVCGRWPKGGLACKCLAYLGLLHGMFVVVEVLAWPGMITWKWIGCFPGIMTGFSCPDTPEVNPPLFINVYTKFIAHCLHLQYYRLDDYLPADVVRVMREGKNEQK
eukprot:scaffold299776_cov21-Tisochrysis_lutea.AAC.3